MARVKQTKQTSAQYQETIARLEAQWKRALADYQNLEKRTQGERLQFVKLANIGLIKQILPILDGLERANTHIQDQGLELLLKQFVEVIKNEGVEEIPALNLTYEPKIMECVETEAAQTNLVLRVVEKGYAMGDLIVRPAKVVVGNGQPGNIQSNINQ